MDKGCGYAGKILRVNLSTGQISSLPTSLYADRFLGGRGVAAKLYWDLVPPDAKPFDPENIVVFMTGPVAGFAGLSGSRWQVCTKSPVATPEVFSYSNLGGHWGAQLKFAGFDGLVVEGASERPVYLLIRDERVEIKDASHLSQLSAVAVREMIKDEHGREVRVVATGPAGDNLVRFAILLADGDASGSSGIGAVMGSKKLKAVAVRGTGKVRASDPVALRALVDRTRMLLRPSPELDWTEDNGLPETAKLKREVCFGCTGDCKSPSTRAFYHAADGTRGKVLCQPSRFYSVRALRYYGRRTEVPFFANRLCDAYGIDTMVVETTIMWLARCQRAGLLTDENTGLPLSKLGSLEFIEALVKKIALREGFGEVLAQGPSRAAETIGSAAVHLITDYISGAEQVTVYGPRMFISTGLLYAMEPRQPMQQLHEICWPVGCWDRWRAGEKGAYMSSALLRRIAERFWGSEDAVDFSTYEGKALAALKIQDREYAKESLILCDNSWPITYSDCTPDHLGDPTLESRILTAVTGQQMDEDGLSRIGERVFNLQRAVLAREGRLGRESDRLREAFFTVPLKGGVYSSENWAPGKDGEPFQKTGSVVDRDKFEQMKTEYYQLRGWDPASGLQTSSKLRDLGLGDIAAELAQRGMLAN